MAYELKSNRYFLTASMITLTAGNPSWAQAIPEVESSIVEESQQEVGEIIVTAQKRAESINDVGMAITALSGEDLTRSGIESVGDLAKVVPGFVYAQSQKGAPVFSLRGVGFYEESLGASPAVSVYVDEVGYAFPIMSKAATLDLERVEVLKGPQGTLFGQNSTGGAINYIAAKPSQHFEAGINTSIDKFGQLIAGGFISGGISDNISVRFAADAKEGGAWQRSASRGDKNGAADIMRGRFLLDWMPTESLKVSLNLNGFRDRSEPLAASLLQVTPQSPARATARMLAQIPVPERPGLADWGTGNKMRIKETLKQGSLRIDQTISDALALTSITSLSRFDQDDLRDTDGSPLKIFLVGQNGRIESFSQEVRASGSVFGGKANYVVGGFYANDKAVEKNTLSFVETTSASAFLGITGQPIDTVRAETDQKTITKAIFGNIDMNLTPWLSAHAGLRHTWSNIDFTGCMRDIDGLFAPGTNSILARINPSAIPVAQGQCVTVLPDRTAGDFYTASLDQENTSWRLGVDVKPSSGTLIYGTVSRGFKSGSFPNINATTYISFAPVTQESVTAYELGVKTNMGSRIAHLNASVFYYDYADKQFRGRIQDPLGVFGASEALVNVPKSRVQGAEASLRLEPTNGLSITGGVTYLDTKVTSDFTNFDPFGRAANFQGEPFPFTPKWTLQGGFNFTTSLNQRLDFFLGSDVSYRTSTTSAFGSNPTTPLYSYELVRIKPYALVDAQFGVKSSDDQWQLGFWIQNLTNKYYWTDAFRQIDNVSRHVGEPRTYGLRFSHDFR